MARVVAVFLAMLSHALGQVGLVVPEAVGLTMRVATPMFIVIFGCMITLVHIPRYEKLTFGEFTIGCWARAGECYLWFLLNIVVIYSLGGQSLLYAIRSAMFLGSTSYVQILAFYTIYFLALPWFIWGLKRFGLVKSMTLAILVHVAFVPMKNLQVPYQTVGFEYLQRIIDLLFGAGVANLSAGPSILHSFALLLGGVWIGLLLADIMKNRRGYASFTFPVLLFGLLSVWSVTQNSIVSVTATTLSDMTLRNLNHPAYTMIYGTFAFLIVIALTLTLRNIRFPRELLVLGQRSLFVFGFGNVIVSCWTTSYQNGLYRSLSALALMSTIVAAVYAYDVLLTRTFATGATSKLAKMVRGFTTFMKDLDRVVAAKLVHLCLSQSSRQAREINHAVQNTG